MVQEVRVFSETLAELRVWEVAQLLEELGIEARRRRGARPARAPRARARTALRRDAPEPRPSAPPASRRRRLPHAERPSSVHTLTNDIYAQCVRCSVSYELNWQTILHFAKTNIYSDVTTCKITRIVSTTHLSM